MTEQELRQKVVDYANSWMGATESNGRRREIIDLYNAYRPRPRGYAVKYTDMWCATFVSAVGIGLGLTDIMFPECSCPQMVNLYNKAGRWVESDSYVASVGDIVMYDWGDGNAAAENTGTPDHVGIVIANDGKNMTIIEGNLNNSVKTRKLSVNGKYIRGYCCPDYANKTNNKTETITKATYTI